MIRTLKKTVSDITCNTTVTDPDSVERFTKDLLDFSESNIRLDRYGNYVDNSDYISKALSRVIDVISLFEALNNVVDDLFSRIRFTKTQGVKELWPILYTYGEMMMRYEHFHLWFKNDMLLLDQNEISLHPTFSPGEISSIKLVIKNQYTLLLQKLDDQSDKLQAFINKYTNTSIYPKILFQLNKIKEEIDKLRSYCQEGINLYW